MNEFGVGAHLFKYYTLHDSDWENGKGKRECSCDWKEQRTMDETTQRDVDGLFVDISATRLREWAVRGD